MFEMYGERQLSEEMPEIPERPEVYRARAKEMLILAAKADTAEVRASLTALAENWEGLAQWVENRMKETMPDSELAPSTSANRHYSEQ